MVHRLALRVDGLAATARVFAPIGGEAPLDQVQRALARLVVLPNNEQFLAGCSIVARGDVTHAAVADSKPFDNAEGPDF